MALNRLRFEFQPENARRLPVAFVHYGVVGSGDMEVILERRDLGGKTVAIVVTPVSGFDHVWELVLRRFIDESGLADAEISINDNNATPVVVSQRLRQALLEIEDEEGK
jgi:malonate decarboxylase acyl carrier protein